MEAPHSNGRRLVLIFIGLSLLVHFSVMIGLYLSRWEPNQLDRAVYVDLMPNLPPQALPLPNTDKQDQKQIVESDVAPNTDAPKDAKYLGERSQTVEEETKSKTVDSFRKGGAASKAGDGKRLSLKDLAPPVKEITPPTQAEIDGFRERQKQQKQVARAETGSGGSLAPDSPGGSTNDFLKDTKEGDRTMLNTKEFVYFGYYRRIRQKLEVAWNSRLRSALDGYVYGGRQLASDKNYITGVVVVLDRNGRVTGVQVLQGSGARDLDQAAVDAFNQAGPFPDPPSGLVDDKGKIEIRWDFVLQS